MSRSTLVILTLVLGCGSAWGAPEKGLVAHWDFMAGRGDALKDRSGNKNDGKITGARWVKSGKRSALRFDGSGDYVDFGNNAKLKLGGDFTVAMWVKFSAADFPNPLTNYTILDCEQYPESGVIIRIDGAGGKVLFRTNRADGSKTATSGRTLENRKAYYFVVTRKGDDVQLYLNAFPTAQLTVGPHGRATAPFRISHASQSFNGLIYAMKIYSRASSKEEVIGAFMKNAAGYKVKLTWDMPAAATEKGKALMSDKTRTNLAARENACWTVTSSTGNFDSLYSNNLIDEDLNTAWRSFQETSEEWAEMAWDFEMAVDRVVVHPHELSRVATLELLAWQRDAWRPLGKRNLGGKQVRQAIEFSFDTLMTKRLRLLMRNDKARFTGLREVQVFGPDQPLITMDNDGGKWTYMPISRVEAMKEYVTARRAGKRPKRYVGAAETLVVEGARVQPAHAKPGSDVRVTLKLKPRKKLSDDYVLVVTVGEREKLWQRSDYSVARVILRPKKPLSSWAAGRTRTVGATIYIPKHAPHGRLDVMLHSASPAGRPPLRLLDRRSKAIDDGNVARVSIRRFKKTPPPDRKRHAATIDTSNGTVISIDGRKVAPILFALQTPSFDRYHYYTQQAGVKLYHLQIYPFRVGTGNYQQRNYEFVAGHVRNMLRVDPDAYAIIQMDLRSGQDWQAANPEGCLYSYDGKRHHESFCSKEYRDAVVSYITNLVKFVESKPWRNRVIGYLCELGEPEGVLSGGPDLGDYNPQAIQAFREFARKKYGGDVARFRKAYKAPALTFEKLYPTYAKVSEDGVNGGCFLDPRTQRLAIDYHEFVSSIIPTFLMEHCAGTIKRLTNGRALVGSYWAYMVEDITHGKASHQGNHSYLHHVLASPNLDFFASPFNYWHPARYAGEPYLPFQPYDSLRINGKLHIPECDHRTFRAGTVERKRNRSREETLAIIRRDMGTALMHGMGAWFSDWTNNDRKERRLSEPYFLDDQLLDQIAELRVAYQESIDAKREKAAETAVFVSGTSYYYHDNNARPIYSDIIRNCLYFNFNMAGAPYDQLIFEDILKPEIQSGYKCYVFINAFYMTEEQRAVVQGLKRDGNTLVWIYAPGYVRDSGLSVENMQEITGFKVAVEHKKQALAYKLAMKTHPITKDVEDKRYGGKEGDVSPRFHVTDGSKGVRVLGRYADKKVAFVVRDFRTHKSVYCAVPHLSTAVFRNILRYAGCHIYVDDDIYMDATRDVLMLTNTFERGRTLSVRLPRTAAVSDLLSGEVVAPKGNSFKVKIAPGETLLYRLK